jgi:UDP-N-acetylmuramate--alanine ligase
VTTLIPGQHIHLVGIGGFGLSAIARVLLQKGFRVSGSDRMQNAFTIALAQEGVAIHIGHDAAYVEGADLVIATSAAPADHVELAAARALGTPVCKRSDMIAALMAGQHGIAIAGTHGKTTTTAMLTHILLSAGQDPSYIIGGILRTTGTNAGVGKGPAFVIEADEYDNMFHGLRPQTAVITNVEWDHPDFFPTPQVLSDSFRQFADLLPSDGLLIACADDPGAAALAAEQRMRGISTVSYGFGDDALWRAANLRRGSSGLSFTVKRGDASLADVHLKVPGRHNVLNALAALIAADHHSVDVTLGAEALASFTGTGRRFEVRGEVGGVTVIDDYAHHPTAIRATLEAVRGQYPDHALWAVWQPHTFSRTRALFDAYTQAFGDADHVLVTEIYAAREQPVEGVSGAIMAAAVQHADARHAPTHPDAVDLLAREVRRPAVVVIMSAGDAPWIGAELLRQLEANTP